MSTFLSRFGYHCPGYQMEWSFFFQSSNTVHETQEGEDGSLRVYILLSLFLLSSDAQCVWLYEELLFTESLRTCLLKINLSGLLSAKNVLIFSHSWRLLWGIQFTAANFLLWPINEYQAFCNLLVSRELWVIIQAVTSLIYFIALRDNPMTMAIQNSAVKTSVFSHFQF